MRKILKIHFDKFSFFVPQFIPKKSESFNFLIKFNELSKFYICHYLFDQMCCKTYFNPEVLLIYIVLKIILYICIRVEDILLLFYLTYRYKKYYVEYQIFD